MTCMMSSLYMRECLGHSCGVGGHTGTPQRRYVRTQHEYQHSVAFHIGMLACVVQTFSLSGGTIVQVVQYIFLCGWVGEWWAVLSLLQCGMLLAPARTAC